MPQFEHFCNEGNRSCGTVMHIGLAPNEVQTTRTCIDVQLHLLVGNDCPHGERLGGIKCIIYAPGTRSLGCHPASQAQISQGLHFTDAWRQSVIGQLDFFARQIVGLEEGEDWDSAHASHLPSQARAVLCPEVPVTP